MMMPPRATLALSLLSLCACDRIRSAVGRGDEGGTSAAQEASLAFLGSSEGDIGIALKGKAAGKSPNETVNTDLLVKNAKLRFELPKETGPQAQANPLSQGYVVVHTPDKKLYFVMDAQKQAIVVDLNKAGQQVKSVSTPPHLPSAHAEPPPPPPKVVKTGRKSTVAGYTCEDWEITSQDNSKADVCVAQEGPSWFSLPITGIPTEHLWAAELLDGKHFPLRFIGYDKAGAEEGRAEVTHIDK